MDWSGIYSALPTPLRAGGLDEEALSWLLAGQRAGRVEGVVAAGTTGEASTLSDTERRQLIRRCVAEAGPLRVIAGVGTNHTAESQRRAAEAQALGAGAGLVVTPYYNKPSGAGIHAHFEAVARAAPGWPLILYTVPSRTGGELPLAVAEALSHHPSLVAIKDATGDLAYGARLIQRCGDRCVVLSGDDPTALAHWALGGQGSISVISNLVPAAFSGLWRQLRDGALLEAREAFHALLPMIDALFLESNPIPLKAALSWMSEGAMTAELRLPLTPLSEASAAQLRARWARWSEE